MSEQVEISRQQYEALKACADLLQEPIDAAQDQDDISAPFGLWAEIDGYDWVRKQRAPCVALAASNGRCKPGEAIPSRRRGTLLAVAASL